MGDLKDTDVAMAYLPPGWIGQNLFGYVQPMVVGYCICCSESSDTMLADMPIPVGNAVRQILGITQAMFGPESDFTSVVRPFEQWAGVEVRSPPKV